MTTSPSGSENPLEPFFQDQGILILDGGLATHLEARGFDLADDLWSARVLAEDPQAIRKVHADYLAAGADCISTSTYQASIPGFRKRGMSDDRAQELLRLAIRLGTEARDDFWGKPANRPGRLRPLVAASVGPYGAFLADGSEYTGQYAIDRSGLMEFHRRRWEILAGSEADLIACETIPSRPEAGVLLGLLRDTPARWAWMSFSCRDGTHLSDGSRLAEAAEECEAEPRIVAVGINCTSPELISPLIAEARKGTTKPILVYPNSGERYNAGNKSWAAAPYQVNWKELSGEWARLGAAGIGGCCRVGPPQIAEIRHRLVAPP